MRVVPGLLQTEEYARAAISAGKPRGSGATIDRTVSARLERQMILAREKPPMLGIVVETITPAEPGIGSPLIPASWHLAHRDRQGARTAAPPARRPDPGAVSAGGCRAPARPAPAVPGGIA